MTIRSTTTMVAAISLYCSSNGRCGSRNCGSTARMKTIALGLLALTTNPRSIRLSGLPMGRGAAESSSASGCACHCFQASQSR